MFLIFYNKYFKNEFKIFLLIDSINMYYVYKLNICNKFKKLKVKI